MMLLAVSKILPVWISNESQPRNTRLLLSNLKFAWFNFHEITWKVAWLFDGAKYWFKESEIWRCEIFNNVISREVTLALLVYKLNHVKREFGPTSPTNLDILYKQGKLSLRALSFNPGTFRLIKVKYSSIQIRRGVRMYQYYRRTEIKSKN